MSSFHERTFSAARIFSLANTTPPEYEDYITLWCFIDFYAFISVTIGRWLSMRFLPAGCHRCHYAIDYVAWYHCFDAFRHIRQILNDATASIIRYWLNAAADATSGHEPSCLLLPCLPIMSMPNAITPLILLMPILMPPADFFCLPLDYLHFIISSGASRHCRLHFFFTTSWLASAIFCHYLPLPTWLPLVATEPFISLTGCLIAGSFTPAYFEGRRSRLRFCLLGFQASRVTVSFDFIEAPLSIIDYPFWIFSRHCWCRH